MIGIHCYFLRVRVLPISCVFVIFLCNMPLSLVS